MGKRKTNNYGRTLSSTKRLRGNIASLIKYQQVITFLTFFIIFNLLLLNNIKLILINFEIIFIVAFIEKY